MYVYVCKGRRYSCGGCGYDFDILVITVANCEYEALGLVLMDYPETRSEDWEIDEISVHQPIPKVFELRYDHG